MSIFAKAGERTGLRFANAAESNAEGRFDLSNGTVTFAGTNTTFVGIEDYGNGWYRCIISFIASTTIAQLNLRLMDGSSLSYQGDGTSGLYAWGAQLEQQSYPTSYIPTSGATATRNQELCNNATPVINSEEGTLYAEISALADDGTVRRLLLLSDGTTNNSVSVEYSVLNNLIRIRLRSGNVEQSFYQSTNYDFLQYHKIALSYKLNDFKIYIDGVLIHTDTSLNTPINLSELSFSNGTITIDNVSVKEVTTATNTPRIDYSTGEKAFLLEPQSTNLSAKSQNIGGWSFPVNVTTTQDYGTSPDGSVNSTRLQFTANGFMNDGLTLTNGTEYTLSVYAKRNDTETQSFGFYVNGNPTIVGGITLTDEWQRFTYTYTASSNSSIGLAGNSGADVSVFGFQAEQQSYATSYIPTAGASATRNQELCNNATPVINSEEGTLYAEISALDDDGNDG